MDTKRNEKSYKRARSDEQKADRREAILDAAETQLAETGIEKFSMATLSKAVGIARGTLYLYFGTRESVLLTLYHRHLNAWCNTMETALPGPTDDATFLDAYWSASRSDPVLIQLGSRLGPMIEHNISMEELQASKTEMYAILQRVQRHFALVLGLSPEQTRIVSPALGSLSMGVNQLCAGPEVDPDGLAPEVAAMARTYRQPKLLFTAAANLLLAGVRGPG